MWASDSDRAQARGANHDGVFRFPNLAPGEYHLIAFEGDDPFEDSPEFRKLYESQTVTVKVQEGSHETVELKLIHLN